MELLIECDILKKEVKMFFGWQIVLPIIPTILPTTDVAVPFKLQPNI